MLILHCFNYPSQVLQYENSTGEGLGGSPEACCEIRLFSFDRFCLVPKTLHAKHWNASPRPIRMANRLAVSAESAWAAVVPVAIPISKKPRTMLRKLLEFGRDLKSFFGFSVQTV